MVFDQLSVVLAGLAILIAVGYTAQLTVKSDVDVDSLPWVGLKSGVFAGPRTRIGNAYWQSWNGSAGNNGGGVSEGSYSTQLLIAGLTLDDSIQLQRSLLSSRDPTNRWLFSQGRRSSGLQTKQTVC
jgi:hypothetical protein